jgi:CheY-like chemotaxis protein
MIKKKVLVIDDSIAMAFIMKKALELKDYEVRTEETFMGLESIKKEIPNLIFLDVSLAGKDGRDVARELKQNVDTKDIPIVMLTAYLNASQLAEEAGADGYLSKPFGLVNLWEQAAKYTG